MIFSVNHRPAFDEQINDLLASSRCDSQMQGCLALLRDTVDAGPSIEKYLDDVPAASLHSEMQRSLAVFRSTIYEDSVSEKKSRQILGSIFYGLKKGCLAVMCRGVNAGSSSKEEMDHTVSSGGFALTVVAHSVVQGCSAGIVYFVDRTTVI